MGETKARLMPGTSLSYSESDTKAFSRIELLISAAGGLSLSQVCSITGLEGSTIQNWVKRGWVSNPRGKKYNEAQVARILIINALKECVKLESITKLMSYVNGFTQNSHDFIIKESELFNYLCDALNVLSRAEDFSRSGVEAVAEHVVRDYQGPYPDSRLRLCKVLSVMIFACVCTDVKRRTETMLFEVLSEQTAPAQPETIPEVVLSEDYITPVTAEIEAVSTISGTHAPDDAAAYSRPVIDDALFEPEVKKTPAAAPQRSWFFKKST